MPNQWCTCHKAERKRHGVKIKHCTIRVPSKGASKVQSWDKTSSVAGVTTPCTNTCHNTSPHGCCQSLNDVSRNSAPNVQQNWFQLLLICWGRYALSQLSIKMITEMLYGIHVWRTWWPRQNVDINIVEIILNKSGCMRSCIVLGCWCKNGTTTGHNTSSLYLRPVRCSGLHLALWPLVFLILDSLVPGLSADNGSTSCWWWLDCSWRFLQSAVRGLYIGHTNSSVAFCLCKSQHLSDVLFHTASLLCPTLVFKQLIAVFLIQINIF